MSKWTVAVAATIFLCGVGAQAQEYLTEAKASFIFNGERVKIDRSNREADVFAARFASSDGSCESPCIAPMQAAEGVETFDETQVLAFLVEVVAGNKGLMVDARLPAERAAGFIPGTVSLPHATVAAHNEFKYDILRALGAREFDGVFNFTDARHLLVYDTGPSKDDAGQLINNLLALGYPAEMIKYYRGGMQVWSVLGFSIEEDKS